MATLNEVKINAIRGSLLVVGGTVNELEHQWVDSLGATTGKTLNEKWYEVFGGTGSWNGAAMAWLQAQTLAVKQTLNEQWILYWNLPR